ncbi:MAG TPA: hypothetical protein VJK51_00010 [Candidatus Nanoarchaeia archaeon]|nr:hypothetical protein [Candidatus Nanoarchaeia archaeon]
MEELFPFGDAVKREFRDSLERAGYMEDNQSHVTCGIHGCLHCPHELTYEHIGLLETEVDYRRRLEGKEVLVFPAEFVGGREGLYTLFTRPRKE